MMKSWQIIKDAWTGSIWELVGGSICVAAFVGTLILLITIIEVLK